MRFLWLLVVLAWTSVASAQDPQIDEQLVNEITELRAANGGEAVVSDQNEFRDAVRGLSQQQRNLPFSPRSVTGVYMPAPNTQYVAPPQHSPAPCCGNFPQRFGPRPDGLGPPQPRQPKSEKSQLREVAFSLDQIAHRLEMSDLTDAADTVREAAEELRESARELARKQAQPGRRKAGQGGAFGSVRPDRE